MNDIDRLYPQAEGQPGRLQLSGQRKPKALIALERAESDAWREVVRIADVFEACPCQFHQNEVNAAVNFATEAMARATQGYRDFYRDPDPWWAAEDEADTREAGSL